MGTLRWMVGWVVIVAGCAAPDYTRHAVRVHSGRGGWGGGVVIGHARDATLVLTAGHVLVGGPPFRIDAFDPDELGMVALLVAVTLPPGPDLALLRVRFRVPRQAVPIADPRAGDACVTAGCPGGLRPYPIHGHIVGPRPGEMSATEWAMATPATWGSAGGPVLDSAGRLVGITSRGAVWAVDRGGGGDGDGPQRLQHLQRLPVPYVTSFVPMPVIRTWLREVGVQ